MSGLYLVAHKVRGEAAFDVATQIECAECAGQGEIGSHPDKPMFACSECDGTGLWWIIPTSGHRAYPWWHRALNWLIDWEMVRIHHGEVPPMPPDLSDHYATRAEPEFDLTAALGIKSKPQPPIKRRM